jgi:hypothetical protein
METPFHESWYCCPAGPVVVGVKGDRWRWFCVDHLDDAEAQINALHMLRALELGS